MKKKYELLLRQLFSWLGEFIVIVGTLWLGESHSAGEGRKEGRGHALTSSPVLLLLASNDPLSVKECKEIESTLVFPALFVNLAGI